MDNSLQIHSVKRTKKAIIIEYTNPANSTTHKISCNQSPLPEFAAAFENLAEDAVDFCEWPPSWCPNIHVTGVSVREKADRTGYVLSGSRMLTRCKSPHLFSTPFKWDASETSTGDGVIKGYAIDRDTVTRIDTLLSEAVRYVNGKRAQGTLEFDNLEAEATVEDDIDPDQMEAWDEEEEEAA